LIEPFSILMLVTGALLVGEITAATAVHFLKRTCQWIVTPQDLSPTIDIPGLDKFIAHGWDPELGWCRKPNTNGIDTGWGETHAAYSIDPLGARSSPGYADARISVLAYGDSYTFCRQVEDTETWPEQLSHALNARVANFGIGNYGLDQALLRLEREYDKCPAPVVIIGVVPETISRVLSVWKHFSEYGNTFAFKPKFSLSDKDELALIENPVQTYEQFFAIDKCLPLLQKQDFFYQRKFVPDMLRFPYLWHLWHSRKRNLPLLKAALCDRMAHEGRNAFNQVMKRNINIAAELYCEHEPVMLLRTIVQRFANFTRQKGAIPVLVFLPQLYDLHLIRSGDHYYANFLDRISNELEIIDLGPMFDKDADNYIDDRYGGHLSAAGNRLAAQKIAETIKTLLNVT
jgi:hypothetical protein